VIIFLTVSFTQAANVKEVFLYFDQNQWDHIYENWEEEIYIPCTVKFDGKEWTDCEMRFRGDGSKELARKSLKVKFNDEAFATGRKKLNLNVDYYDKTRCHNHLASTLFNLTGYPTFKTEHYRVYCNDVYHGLYISVENMDTDFLASRGLNPDDNLYKATVDGACLHYRDEPEEVWEKKTNEREPWIDLKNLIIELNQIPDDNFYDYVKDNFDYDNIVNYFALSLLLTNSSTYNHNYYMFHNSKIGKWQLFAWDMDKTFSTYGVYHQYRYYSDMWFYDNPLFIRSLDDTKIFADIKSRINELEEKYFNAQFMTPILDSLENVLTSSALEDTLFHFGNAADYSKEFDKELDFINKRRDELFSQFDRVPGVFKCSAPDRIEFEPFLVTWDEAENNADEGEVLYKFSYGDNPIFSYGTYKVIEGIKDNQFMMDVMDKDGSYYYRVDAYNSKSGETMMSYHKKNKFKYISNPTKIDNQINGEVRLTADKSPYYIYEHVQVSKKGTIIIEAGAEVYISAKEGITVEGTFIAKGSSDNPANIYSKYDLSGVQINLKSGSRLELDNANIKNIRFHSTDCDVRIKDTDYEYNEMYSTGEIINDVMKFEGYSGKVEIDNLHFFGNPRVEALYVSETDDVVINDSKFENCWDGIQLYLIDNKGVLTNNKVRYCRDDAVDMNKCMNILIEGNEIHQVNDKGLSLWASWEYDNPQMKIKRNIITNTGTGIAVKNNLHAQIANNTIVNSGKAIDVYEKDKPEDGYENHPKISAVNNIFYNCDNVVKYDALGTGTINYSLSNNSEISGKNNIQADPLFENVEEYKFELQSGSPCIDAGNPNSERDEDGTISDLGALQIYQSIGKKDDIVINEINYNSADNKDSGDWVELYNNSNSTTELKNWYFSDSDNAHKFKLPAIDLDANDYLVLFANESDFRDVYGKVNPAIGEFDFGLSGGGELIRLFNDKDELVDFVEYSDNTPWPEGADGDGKTLELINPNFDNTLPESWKDSEEEGGSPCMPNSATDTIDENKKVTYKLYPNPCKELISFDFENLGDIFEYSIIDVNGKVFYKSKSILKTGTIQIVTAELATGVYYLMIKTENGKTLIPFVKE
jgi:spore coat protein H